jgi:hypothetical protein
VTDWVVTLSPEHVVTHVFELPPLAETLAPVTVEGTAGSISIAGFEDRRRRGRGVFLTEANIEALKATRVSDVLRAVPGVRLMCDSRGCAVRMSRAARECRPDYYMDGMPATFSSWANMSPQGIVGIEVYRSLSETPLEFLRADNVCGTIVIWTRSGP